MGLNKEQSVRWQLAYAEKIVKGYGQEKAAEWANKIISQIIPFPEPPKDIA
jgi:hypothetical protein